MIKKDDMIRTPRFCHVRISDVFETSDQLLEAGFSEPTYFEDPEWEIRGKSIGLNRMIFAAAKKN